MVQTVNLEEISITIYKNHQNYVYRELRSQEAVRKEGPVYGDYVKSWTHVDNVLQQKIDLITNSNRWTSPMRLRILR